MPSYQDIETRLRVVEDKLDFIMRTTRMKGVFGSPVLDANGRPQRRVADGTMLDWYHLSKQADRVEVIEGASDAARTE